jgi:hypothetical protein
MQLWFLNGRLRHPRRWLSATLLAELLVMATAGAFFMYLADEIGEQARLTQLDCRRSFSITTAPPGPCACSKPSRFSAMRPPWA